MTDEVFLFDDFFATNESVVDVDIMINGRCIPIGVSHGLSLGEREAAQKAGIKRKFNKHSGQIEVESVDDTAIGLASLKSYIKRWPFTYSDGTPVPITTDNILLLTASGVDQLLTHLRMAIENKAAAVAGPFAKASAKD